MSTQPEARFAPDDWQPLTAVIDDRPPAAADLHGFWHDVWQHFRGNRAAVTGLLTVLLLVLTCGFGPLLWRVDPTAIHLDQIALPPTLGQLALVSASTPLPANVTALSVQAPASTDGVTLAWPAVPGSHYRVYRHLLAPSGLRDLGVPLADLRADSALVEYRDQLRLEPRTYYYSVLALEAQQTMAAVRTLAVPVRHAGAVSPHPLGTDQLGRDILARILQGGRISLGIGLIAPLLFVTLGAIYGALAGFAGGRTDTLMMAFADFVLSLPFLLFVILLRMAFGISASQAGGSIGSLQALLFALVVLGWPNSARLVRALVLQLRGTAFIDAARLQGASALQITLRHLLPNVLPSLLVALSFAIPSAIFTEAFLSFIGLGIVPPTASWGSMSNDALGSLLTHPHELLFPAVFISLTVLAFNLLGDGLRDALDSQQRGHQR